MVFTVILIEYVKEKLKAVAADPGFDLICYSSLRVKHLAFNYFYLKLNIIQTSCQTFC